MQIRHVKPGDEAELAFLLEEHERHYGAEVREGAGKAGAEFVVKGGSICLVAEDAPGKLAGFALLSLFFPAPRLTQGLYLKELYVADRARSKGVGEKLMDAIRAFAKERGCSRVLWTTNPNNTGSQRFYERLGAKRVPKVYYVMDL
jgi:ribosomal protein S18 acetylase RimI-like enzyme